MMQCYYIESGVKHHNPLYTNKCYQYILTNLKTFEVAFVKIALQFLRKDISMHKYIIKLATLFRKCVLDIVGRSIDAS